MALSPIVDLISVFRYTSIMTLEARDAFFQPNRERLEQMAWRALQRGLTPEQFVTVCIDVDDPSWTEIVDLLMPGHNWQEYRDRGEKPVARGIARAGINDYLRTVAPDIETVLTGPLLDGTVRAIVMAYGGVSVYFITPTPQYKNN